MRTSRHAWVGVLLALVATVLGLTLGVGRAFASNEDVHGRLVDGDKAIAGVKIVVTTPDNQPVGQATTGADGGWVVALPGPGSYRITLDTSTLPSGETLRDPGQISVVRDVITDQQRPQLFALGAGQSTASAPSETDRTAQLIAEGLRFGLILGLAAVGLSLIYGTTGLVNFAARRAGHLWGAGGVLAERGPRDRVDPRGCDRRGDLRGHRVAAGRVVLGPTTPARHWNLGDDDRLDRRGPVRPLRVPVLLRRGEQVLRGLPGPVRRQGRAVAGGVAPIDYWSMAIAVAAIGAGDARGVADPAGQSRPRDLGQPVAGGGLRHRRGTG